MQEIQGDQIAGALAAPGLRLIQWGANWCAPCQAQKSDLLKFEGRTGIEVLHVEVERCPASTLIDMGIMKVPTLTVHRDGKEIGRFDRIGLSELIGAVEEIV